MLRRRFAAPTIEAAAAGPLRPLSAEIPTREHLATSLLPPSAEIPTREHLATYLSS